ncbi:GGDEF domain-containing protein [Bradyrhizobium sp. DOA9]|uniref:GGDEF domain-containing protein n=1 Tax=Bradyrhizobium sp. DOA9 TaxID=1126627 RepID=UPI000A63F81A|nr:GGDEF domain-containing protein [Bradyrhizobium sp. DOA9]
MAARKRSSTAFPSEIEKQFEADTHIKRCKRLTTGLLVSAPLYNLFLLADWLLVPDVVHLAVWLHLAIVTPWMLAAALIISRRPRPFIRECLAASVPLAIILQIDVGFAFTSSPAAAHYQYVVIPTLLYTNVSLHRLQFVFARAVTALVLALHLSVVLRADYLSAPVAVTIIVQIGICAYITLVANYTMERDLRRAYLFSLRDRLRHAEADAASRRDALTGLANRFELDEELRRIWSASADLMEVPISVVMVDIDHFKRLNDQYGHSTGDLCLKRVAALLTTALRCKEDVAVRYGGEEFMLLLPGVEIMEAVRTAERVRRSIESLAIPNHNPGFSSVVTASFGVATSAPLSLSSAELIAAADQALYAAKRNGRNQVWPPFVQRMSEHSGVLTGSSRSGSSAASTGSPPNKFSSLD